MNAVATIAKIILVLIACGAVAWVGLYARARFRDSAEMIDEAAHVHRENLLRPYDPQMRYKGGDAPCDKCRRPTPYTLNGVPMHGECREDVA
jgi:hypothetical protein